MTVREIAKEAGVAAGLLYNHFADKDELLAMALLERGPAFASGGVGPLSEPGSSTVVDNLHEYAMAAIVVLRDVLPVVLTATPALMGRIAGAIHSGSNPHIAARAKVGEYLRAEQRLGRVRADADVDIAALLISGALHETALFAGLGAPPQDDEVVVRRIVETVTAAIT